MKLNRNEFLYDSESLDRQIVVMVDVYAAVKYAYPESPCFSEDDVSASEIDDYSREVKIEDLPESERKEIFLQAEGLFNDLVCDEIFEYQCAKADALFDSWKDRDDD